LVDGRAPHTAGSLINADASSDSAIKADPETIVRIMRRLSANSTMRCHPPLAAGSWR
jgi:hypothetical protein